MREKEKLFITSNFSFSHSVFYPFVLLSAIYIKSKIVVCKLFHFGRTEKLKYVLGRVENIMEKGYQQFLLFSQFFQNTVFISELLKAGILLYSYNNLSAVQNRRCQTWDGYG